MSGAEATTGAGVEPAAETGAGAGAEARAERARGRTQNLLNNIEKGEHGRAATPALLLRMGKYKIL